MSKRVLFEFFNKSVYIVQKAGDIEPLRTMFDTLPASDTMACLPDPLKISVITNQKCATGSAIVCIVAAPWHVPLVDTIVVELQNAGNINTVRAWHTIHTISTRYDRVLLHKLCRFVKELFLTFVQRS